MTPLLIGLLIFDIIANGVCVMMLNALNRRADLVDDRLDIIEDGMATAGIVAKTEEEESVA